MFAVWFAIRQRYCGLIKGPARSAQQAAIGLSAVALIALVVAAFIPSVSRLVGLITYGAIILLLVFIIMVAVRIYARLDDARWATSLYSNLLSQHDLPANFYMDGAAANPSLQALLYKCLTFVEPQSILELGSGQTTRLIATHCHDHLNCYALTLESSSFWYEAVLPKITRDGRHHDYRLRPLVETQVFIPDHGSVPTSWFSDSDDLIRKTFNLILVDGPDTDAWYSRCGILTHLPAILAKQFVIIFDDAERAGERMTIRACDQLPHAAGLNYRMFEIHGVNSQTVFCSRDLSYLECV